MTDKPSFLIDVDDVLACFTLELTPYLKAILGRDWDPEQIPEGKWDIFGTLDDLQSELIQAKMAEPGFCYGLPLALGAHKFVTDLRERGFEVFAVTAPNYSPNWVHERFLWLRDNFGFDKEHVIHTHGKAQVQGDYFLDDNPKNVRAWMLKNPKGLAMLWDTPMNRGKETSDLLRVSSWSAVLDALTLRSA